MTTTNIAFPQGMQTFCLIEELIQSIIMEWQNVAAVHFESCTLSHISTMVLHGLHAIKGYIGYY